VDSFFQNWYSSALFSFKEPVLSQNFIGHDVYRLLWLRSFHRPVVVSLHQSGEQVWLNAKMLDMQPRFHDDKIDIISTEEKQEYLKQGYFVDKENPDLLVRIADRKANIIYDKKIPLSNNDWSKFEELLLEANFWSLSTQMGDDSTDGAQWIIEAHSKSKYHFVDYHSPGKGKYGSAGRFLIKLSGLDGEKIY